MARRVLSRFAFASSLCLLLTVPALGAATVQKNDGYRRGERIDITGTVVDAGGAPIEGMTVVLLAAHRGFELRGMRRVEEGLVRVPATTDEKGRFTLEWHWDPYYDRFRIRAEGVAATPPDADGGGRQPAVLAEVDMTRRILEGTQVVVSLEVAGAGPHRAEQAFVATDRSDDQSRVFEEMGKPDRVDRLEMSGGDEVTWWYFERGKSFHFRDGRLDQVIEFEPVTGF